MSFKDGKKNIEVVSGSAENLDISPVYSHISISKPKTRKKSNKKIVIPNENKSKEE